MTHRGPFQPLPFCDSVICCGTCRALVPAVKAYLQSFGFRSFFNRSHTSVCKHKSHSALKLGKSAHDDLAYEHKYRLWSTCRDLAVVRVDPHVSQTTCHWCLLALPSRPGTMTSFRDHGPPFFSTEDASPTDHQDPPPRPASSTAPCKTEGSSNISPLGLDCLPPWRKGLLHHIPARNILSWTSLGAALLSPVEVAPGTGQSQWESSHNCHQCPG